MNIVDPLTNLDSQSQTSEEQSLRREFYRTVLSAVPTEPEDDLQSLCRAWLALTGAEWVWLWLLHESVNQKRPWEITAAVGVSGKIEDYLPKNPVPADDRESAAQYCTDIGRPVFVNDFKAWQRNHNGRNYRIVCASELAARGCRSFLSVPLLFPKPNSPGIRTPYSITGDIRGVVCAHFPGEQPKTSLQTEQAYLLLAHATTNAITKSFAAEQHRILFELDSLATWSLATYDGKLQERRREYLAKVIRLIQNRLRTQYVSVFYRSNNPREVECLASTGLHNAQGEPPMSSLAEARYVAGENITGKVFATGTPFISQIGQNSPRAQYKWRETPVDIPEPQLPWVCYPIRTPESNPQDPSSRTTLGVIRCVGNISLLAKSIPRNFDPIQLQTLDFIARQLAPVLETMAVHIRRERNITIIKHDLYAPIRMIDTQADFVDAADRDGNALPKHWLSNIKAALILAKNLAGSLSEQQTFIQEPTFLEGDIVARLKDGLQYFARIENKMSIEFSDIRENFPKLDIDRGLIERALTNLLLNAIKYGHEGTTITVKGNSDYDRFYLSVSNYGIGIDETEQKQIFEGEYRSPRVISVKQGLGLGLKIARAAMQRHGGDLILEKASDPTTFVMVFPRSLASFHKNR